MELPNQLRVPLKSLDVHEHSATGVSHVGGINTSIQSSSHVLEHCMDAVTNLERRGQLPHSLLSFLSQQDRKNWFHNVLFQW